MTKLTDIIKKDLRAVGEQAEFVIKGLVKGAVRGLYAPFRASNAITNYTQECDNDGKEPTNGSYLALDNGTIGAGAGISYDHARRAMLGASNEDLGMLCDVKFPRDENGNSGDWSGVLMVAQNPGGLLSAKGPKACGDVFVVGELPEFKTYLSGIANKGKKGASFRVDGSNIDGKSTWATEAGYHLANGLRVSLGRQFNEGDDDQTYGKVSVGGDNGFAEVRYSENNGLETFLRYQVKLQ